MNKTIVLKELKTIPWIGEKLSMYLYDIGIRSVADLKGKNPENLYRDLSIKRGVDQDRCVLYVFRCAVYYVSTKNPDPEKLYWWAWKDKK